MTNLCNLLNALTDLSTSDNKTKAGLCGCQKESWKSQKATFCIVSNYSKPFRSKLADERLLLKLVS